MQHRRVVEAFQPARVVLTVRSIGDIARSFFEKHRIQDNQHRFDHDWVVTYCRREAAALVDFCAELTLGGVSWRAFRYEDFVASQATRDSLARFVGWEAGGEVTRHLGRLNRAFEIDRHGAVINAGLTHGSQRRLTPAEMALAERIEADNAVYQSAFGYRR